MRTLTVMLCALALAACAMRGSGGGMDGEVTCLTGVVAATGADPSPEVMLRPEGGGESVRLEGELAGLARRMTGATVELCGRSRVAAGAWSLSVDELDLRSVDGMEAHLGVLHFDRGAWIVRRSAGQPRAVQLVAVTVPGSLSDAEGSLVWVAGRWDGAQFAVLSFGVVQ